MSPRIQALLPQRALSRLVGALGRLESPRWLIQAAIGAFARRYGVDLAEADRTLGDYRSFTDFFTRRLAAGARPLAEDPRALVWPADGTVAAGGRVEAGRMLQAKGIDYRVADLLGDQALAARFEGGAYRTVYLSPRDYHRVHAPWRGRLVRRIHLPGRLYSVSEATVAAIPGVFAGNERVVLVLEDPNLGCWVLVLVGALIIGGIETPFEGTINPPPASLDADRRWHEDPPRVARGDEIGLFRAGSTVIVLFAPCRSEQHAVAQGEATEGSAVRMGEIMGRVCAPDVATPASG